MHLRASFCFGFAWSQSGEVSRQSTKEFFEGSG
jgi:hypothetical protein